MDRRQTYLHSTIPTEYMIFLCSLSLTVSECCCLSFLPVRMNEPTATVPEKGIMVEHGAALGSSIWPAFSLHRTKYIFSSSEVHSTL
jgi:hypothetical protein